MSLLAKAHAEVQGPGTVTMTYRQAITAAMQDEMSMDETVVLMGEDVGFPGGVFKTSEGLIEQFGQSRVIDTPICENAFLGVALGMAATGLRPVVEIMFSDFLATGADAMINEIPKFRFMSGGQFTVPLTVRSIGGAAGFGSQHSATAESWYISVDGLKVVTHSSPAAAYRNLRAAIRSDDPILCIEHRGLYSQSGPVFRAPGVELTIGGATVLRRGSDATLVGTMLMVQRGLEAAEQLAQTSGIDVEVIDLQWITPMDIPTVRDSVLRTGRLVVAEEEPHGGGWGALLISKLTQNGVAFAHPPIAVSQLPAPIAFSPPLQALQIPSTQRIVDAITLAAKKGK
jgi:acetoin:2,6-dichlorophenolindophenol oxidoreductase subunit beta